MWKGLKVIGIINVVILLLEMILHTIFVLGFLLHIDAITEHYPYDQDMLNILLHWALSMFVSLILCYYNFGLINQPTSNFVRDWLIAHGIVLIFCLLNNVLPSNQADYLRSNVMTLVLLIEIIVVILFCYVIPSTGGTGNQSANV